MRYICSSLRKLPSSDSSCAKDSLSLPKGFSTITRVQPEGLDAAVDAQPATAVKMDGGMDR
jgi:hypothetical protein